MNEEQAKEIQDYLVQHIKNAKTKEEVETILTGKLDDIKAIHEEYGPASEYLRTAYRADHLERPEIALAYQEYLEANVAGDVLFLDE